MAHKTVRDLMEELAEYPGNAVIMYALKHGDATLSESPGYYVDAGRDEDQGDAPVILFFDIG